jgi:hypothetical protein
MPPVTQQGLSPAAIELFALGADTTISIALLLLVEFNEQVTRGTSISAAGTRYVYSGEGLILLQFVIEHGRGAQGLGLEVGDLTKGNFDRRLRNREPIPQRRREDDRQAVESESRTHWTSSPHRQ